MTLTFKSALLWCVVLIAVAASGLPGLPVVLGSVVVLAVVVRLRLLSKLERELNAGLFPPRRQSSKGQRRYRMGRSSRLSLHQRHPLPARRSAREYASDPKRDQVVSATIDVITNEDLAADSPSEAEREIIFPMAVVLDVLPGGLDASDQRAA